MPEAQANRSEAEATSNEHPARERPIVGTSGLKIVGIGASAGGLRALQRFFAEVPADTGAAFVVVIHMDPDRESNLEEVLQACANIPVEQVKRTLELRPDRIYVIPPGQNLSSVDSHLTLSAIEADRSERAPIDHFLSTLAKTRGEDAVGIVLSGTGHDGTEGLRHIRERGGLTLVQSPQDAEYDSMPQSAIAAGVVDLVLPAGELAEHIARLLGTQPNVSIPSEAEDASAQEAAQDERGAGILRQIFEQIRRRKGHDFSRYKPSTILRRIRRRMQLLYLEDMGEYMSALRKSDAETHALFDDLLITVTSFFRDPEIFQELETALIPRLFEGKKSDETLRVWVAGCSTGEEAYSFAMLLLERARQIPDAPRIQIFATDLQSAALARARSGLYPESIKEHVSKERLDEFFVREQSGGYRVRTELRKLVLFAPHNFLADPPFSRIDLISCRNVMIYLQRDAQRSALELFHYALDPKGHLLLGSSESIDKTLFRPERKDLCLFARNSVPRPHLRLPSIGFARTRGQRGPEDGALPSPPESLERLHHRALERLGPPSILIDQRQNILHLSHHAGRYLVQQGGPPANQLFARLRKELRAELRAALAAAQETKMPQSSRPVPIRVEGRAARILMRACPTAGLGEPDNYLVIFEEQDAGPVDDAAPDRAADLAEMEAEFELMQMGMQSALEQYETSQEEMYAANEELQSSNEELRSTLEELETGKTELQSMNEELAIASQENQLKVEELAGITSDLQNLLVATDIATLFIDRELRILRFTPRAAKFFNVRASDRGRPMGDLRHKFGAGTAELEKDARQVLEDLRPIEREIDDDVGACHLLRLLPYRDSDDKIVGVVITWIDVSRLKKTERALIGREKELRKLTSSLALAEQNERDRIAHILHDDLQQALCALQMRAYLFCEEGKLASDDAAEFLQSLSDAIDMTRALTVDMSPPVLKHEGLMEALGWLKSQMKKLHNLEVTLVADGDLPPLRKEHRSLLFQIARELLFNVVKHARASAATVAVSTAPSVLRIEIADKGAGSARLARDQGNAPSHGFGLSSIIERIALFEGQVHIHSVVGEGTTISIEMPVGQLSQPDRHEESIK